MWASTTETNDDVHGGGGGGHRPLQRSSDSLPMRRSPASHHSWVVLNRCGVQRDVFSAGDRTTSATSVTSGGDEISVSFELVEPPTTSVVTFDWPRASKIWRGNVIAAHRDVVLLAVASYYESESVVDLFVYQASRDRDPCRPSLLLLPSAGGPMMSWRHRNVVGIMSCTCNDVEESPSFVVAKLQISWPDKGDVRLFRSCSGQWESFENMHVHVQGASSGSEDKLRWCWWSTDAVVTYGSRYMIWVDYYRGMVLMDLSSETTANPSPPPRLRYVPLPVNRIENPVPNTDREWGGRQDPRECRGVSVTRYGIKFVSVDSQHCSSFGVGHRDLLTWSQRFRITTWSLREDDDNYTWRKDATMHEEEFLDALRRADHHRFGFPHVQPEFPWKEDSTDHEEEFGDAIDDGGDGFPFPHYQPEFPIVDVDNPDVVVFRLEVPKYVYPDEPKWMIEFDLRKKVLLVATPYSKKEDEGFDPIPSELSRYLDGGQA